MLLKTTKPILHITAKIVPEQTAMGLERDKVG